MHGAKFDVASVIICAICQSDMSSGFNKMESHCNETEWWAEELDYDEEGMEESQTSEVQEEAAVDIYDSLPPFAEEGEIVEEDAVMVNSNKEPSTIMDDFLRERSCGPSSPMKYKQMRSERGSLLKGILAPPVVDSYMKHLLVTVTRSKWDRELERNRFKLGHRFSESVTACYKLIEALHTLLPWEVDEKSRSELYMLAEYAAACLCNALHEWRNQRRSALFHKILSPKHWWLCKERADENSPRLFGRTTAKALIRYVFPPRHNKISSILHEELQSRHKTRFIRRKNSNGQLLSRMEKWVENGCDVFEEVAKLEAADLKLERLFQPTKMDHSASHLTRAFKMSPSKKQLGKKEYGISCDITNAANALLMILERLPKGSRVASPAQVAVYFVCISLFKFDVYRRTGFLSSLRLSKRYVQQLVEDYPIGNQGKLLGDDLFDVVKGIMKK